MQTAVILKKSEWGMVNLKFVSLLFNPKILGALLFIDLTGIMHFITKYIFEDITYLKFLIIACVVDLVTGITKVAVNDGVNAVTSRGLRDTVTKAISYGSFLIIIHVLTHFEIDGKITSSFAWLNKSALEFLILVEIKSVYENIIKINPKLDFLDSVLQNLVNKIKGKKNA